LISELRIPRPEDGIPVDQDAVSQLSQRKKGTKVIEPKKLTVKLRHLLRSQLNNKPPELIRPALRSINLVIPEFDIWDRPLPRKRVKNLEKKHFAQLLDRVLPPIPKDEWNHLRDMVKGKKAFEGPITRRIGRKQAADELSWLQEHIRREKKPEYEAEEPQVRKDDYHKITPRFMRRMLLQVWKQCPMMEWNDQSKNWDVRWGGLVELADGQDNDVHGDELGLFEDVRVSNPS
jgi:hypothetical protein